MQRSIRRLFRATTLACPLAIALWNPGFGQDYAPNTSRTRPPGLLEQLMRQPVFASDRPVFGYVSFQDPTQTVQPDVIGPTTGVVATIPTDILAEISNPIAAAQAIPSSSGGDTPATEVVSVAERQVVGAVDLGSLLEVSNAVQTVSAQQRSPVAYDPRVRGFHVGQIYSQVNGEYWMPVRNDLDSMLSRIDPGLITDIVVVPGPYGLRYGPGFGFIDVQTMDTPRYSGYEAHNRIGTTSRFNGGQFYGYDTFYGGNSNYGFIVGYGNRTGSDYKAGNDFRIPSSYHSQTVTAQIGFDLTDVERVEFRYGRLDQTDTENALQIFDIDDMESDSFSGSYINDEVFATGSLRIDGWYNRSRFNGDTTRLGKRPTASNPTLHVIDRIENALDAANNQPIGTFALRGDVNGDLTSTGGRAVTTFGTEGDAQLRIGSDYRYLEQHTHELFTINQGGQPFNLSPIQTNQPRSNLSDPGVFTELSVRTHPFQTISIGGRLDWVTTDAQVLGGLPEGWRGNTPPASALTNDPTVFPQNDVLYAFYLTDEIDLTDGLQGKLGFGHAQRAPTLTERYADGVFLGIFQSGFSRVIGNPNLDKERNWQIDAGLNADYDFWRGRANVYHSWILDYVTYAVNPVTDPTGAYLMTTINTPNATLTGFETYGEVDVTQLLTVFGSLQYVEGQDQTLGAPLAGIYPLTGRIGVQIRDVSEERRWGTEIGVQLAANQDRLGTFRIAQSHLLETIETATPGFGVAYLRNYYNFTPQCHLVTGIDNLFDRTYFEHLNLRLGRQNANVAGPNFALNSTVSRVLSPGFTPYLGFEWTY